MKLDPIKISPIRLFFMAFIFALVFGLIGVWTMHYPMNGGLI